MSEAAPPFRFGVTAFAAPSAPAWRELAARIEGWGYSSLLVPDHANPQLAPLVALTAAASSTTTLRLGTHVLNNDLRHPSVVAKEIASLDVLSDGRFEWGVGAGWLPIDYQATGVALAPPGARVERLAEAIGLMRALFSGDPVEHDGPHYRVSGIRGNPTPLQRPHPPLLIGAAHPRLLALAGREADLVSISPSFASRRIGSAPPQLDVETSMDRQVAGIRAAAGDRAGAVELSITAAPHIVSTDVEGEAEQAAPGLGLTTSEALRSPHALFGPVERVVETLQERRARWGLSYVVVPRHAAEAFAPVVAHLAGT